MILAEDGANNALFNNGAINRGAYRTSGILGLCAVAVLAVALFFSRFYEYCIGNYKHMKREVLKAAELASNASACS